MTALTSDQTNFFRQNGQFAPIDIFTEDKTDALYEIFQCIENDHGEALWGYGRNNTN